VEDFSGTFVLDQSASDDQSKLLQHLGAPWAVRATLARTSRRVTITHDQGLLWRETVTTALISKTVVCSLDGTPRREVSPVDRTVLSITDGYDDEGRMVVTHVRFPDGDPRSQTMRKLMINGGRTFHVSTVLTIEHEGKPATTIHTNSYFNRVPDA